MKNFWLVRRKKKVFVNRINQINNMIQGVIDKKIQDRFGVKPWRQKRDTKTQP